MRKFWLFCFCWLLGLSVLHAGTASITFDYDGGNWGKSVYDETSLRAFDYDSGAVPVADEKENPTAGFFGRFAQFLAARSGVLPSGGDRLLGTLGPARLNHADELAATIQRIEGTGGNIAWREGQFGFSPAAGQPGRVILDPNASISAVRHEAGHFFDDLGLGHPGMGYYLQNPGARWASEYSSYIREINLARRVGDRQAAWQLLRDARAERAAILGR